MSAESAQAVAEQPTSEGETQTPEQTEEVLVTGAPSVEGSESGAAADDVARAVERLPAGMQQRLAEIIARGGGVADVIRGVEEGLPEFLRSASSPAERMAHPSGEAFFTGEGGGISDAEAEEVARQQLVRSGLLRGQRVRVGD